MLEMFVTYKQQREENPEFTHLAFGLGLVFA
jgi:hypothetical protein